MVTSVLKGATREAALQRLRLSALGSGTPGVGPAAAPGVPVSEGRHCPSLPQLTLLQWPPLPSSFFFFFLEQMPLCNCGSGGGRADDEESGGATVTLSFSSLHPCQPLFCFSPTWY